MAAWSRAVSKLCAPSKLILPTSRVCARSGAAPQSSASMSRQGRRQPVSMRLVPAQRVAQIVRPGAREQVPADRREAVCVTEIHVVRDAHHAFRDANVIEGVLLALARAPPARCAGA